MKRAEGQVSMMDDDNKNSISFAHDRPAVVPRRGRSVAVCAAFIRNHDAFDRLTHYFLSPLQLKSFVAIVGT